LKNPDEFLAFVKRGGLIVPNDVLKNETQESRHIGRQSLPSSVDWRTKGVVSAMKNQGGCGSCWAFSATGTMESAAAIAGASLPNLSEQNLVDCTKADYNGCNGGWMSWAYDYVRNAGGINTQSAYPYTAAV
jgi:cathepsin L